MFKKLISFVCCLVPVGALARIVDVASLTGENGFISLEQVNSAMTDGLVDTPPYNTVNITYGTVLDAGTGLSVLGGMYVGANPTSTSNNLYVSDTANSNSKFIVNAEGLVSIGTILSVLDGWTLEVSDSSLSASGLKVGTTAAPGTVNIDNGATLTFGALDNVEINGNVSGGGNFNIIDVDNVDIDSINNSGVISVSGVGNLQLVGLVSSNDATIDVVNNISVTGVSGSMGGVGGISNTGEIVLTAGGDINVSGSLENTGTSTATMDITANALVVDGTMKNDAIGGNMEFTLGAWTVNGADSNGYSFVNNGNFKAVVSGKTSLAGGFNLETMPVDNTFDLTTGQLVMSANNLIVNKLNSFKLNVTGGDLTLDALVNQSGGMLVGVSAGGLISDYILNQGGIITVNAGTIGLVGDGTGNIQTAIETLGGTATTLTAASAISADTGVSNKGTLSIYSPKITASSVSNSGQGSLLSFGGLLVDGVQQTGDTIQIINNLSNAGGRVNLYANNVSVGGQLVSDGGTTDVKAVNLTVGGVDVNNGVAYFDSSLMTVNNDFVVSGGTVDLSANVANLSVGDDFEVSGNVVYGGMNGMLNIMNNQSTVSADAVKIGGNLDLSSTNYGAILDSNSVMVDGNVLVGENSVLTIGSVGAPGTSGFNVGGELSVAENAIATIYSYIAGAGSVENSGLIKMVGTSLVATSGDIDISGKVRFDSDTASESGLALTGNTGIFVLQSMGAGISLGAVDVDAAKVLSLISANGIGVTGALENDGMLALNAGSDVTVGGAITNQGTLSVAGNSLNLSSVDNLGGSLQLSAIDTVVMQNVNNNSVLSIGHKNGVDGVASVVADDIIHNSGTVDIVADALNADTVQINASGANFTVSNIDVAGNINVVGDLTQNGVGGALNLTDAKNVSANNLIVNGDLVINAGSTDYNIETNVLSDFVSVASDAGANISSETFTTKSGITNSGNLAIAATDLINASVVINNDGSLALQAPSLMADSLAVNGGNVVLAGQQAVFDGAITGGILYQNYAGVLANKEINIDANTYTLTVGNLDVSGINQKGSLIIESSDVSVSGNILADSLKIAANPAENWANVYVGGDVSGNVSFVGLEKMTIGGDYIFNDNSFVNVAVLPYATGGGIDSADINYWSSVNTQEDADFGKITNPVDGAPLISVAGKFMSDLNIDFSDKSASTGAQIGINVFDMIDSGTAIWLLHAEGGVSDLSSKIRNIDVKFCNADASICVAYLNGEWPAYISVRDADGDNAPDSLYVVFDNRFGGPVEVFKIQPIVGREPEHTDGEYVSAGALDEMVAGQLINNKFFNRTPLEVIPEVFKDTNLSEVADQLYLRMEDYVLNRDGAPLTAFSRLFQAHEIELIAGGIALNEHTVFRSFEDRMFDEFIWNRNRKLDKAWLDVDYGMYFQNTTNGNHTDGNRFSVSGGYDWQEDDTTILGFMGRISRNSSSVQDSMDLSYGTVSQLGSVKLDVANTDIGLGAYVLKTLNEENRLYGNAFFNIQMLDVNRSQDFVADINGDDVTFSLISEWGLMHDILNQYIVGNLYARAGYSFGFDIKEKAAGDEYMHLKSDGYFILTPGYSLTAQKRIYPSARFQFRPYASIGLEYDVFGVPDKAEYKFATAHTYTDYDVGINPWWANIGGGVEFLGASGVHVGFDYRYQYNSDIQLHNIKVSGMYRF